jgi:hypothetical protein
MDAQNLKFAPLAALTFLVAHANAAEPKCTVRSADTLIAERYAGPGCKPKAFISYLHNNLVTPYSFTCAKKVAAACKANGCENPTTAEEVSRCLSGYTAILDTCPKELDDAAVMARCKDTKAWTVATIAARFPAATATRTVAKIQDAPMAPVLAAAPIPVTPPAVVVNAPAIAQPDTLVSAPNLTPAPAPVAPVAPIVATAPVVLAPTVAVPTVAKGTARALAPNEMGPPTLAPAPARVYSDVEVIRLSPMTTSSSRVKTTRTKIERVPATTPPANSPITVEPLPNGDSSRFVKKSAQTSQSSRRIR